MIEDADDEPGFRVEHRRKRTLAARGYRRPVLPRTMAQRRESLAELRRQGFVASVLGVDLCVECWCRGDPAGLLPSDAGEVGCGGGHILIIPPENASRESEP